jgi:hypothetical protein
MLPREKSPSTWDQKLKGGMTKKKMMYGGMSKKKK